MIWESLYNPLSVWFHLKCEPETRICAQVSSLESHTQKKKVSEEREGEKREC